MSLMLPSLESVNVGGKRVFVRCDFDARLGENLQIIDDTRLVRCISTIEYLLEEGAIVIAAGHLRRPEVWDERLSLLPIAKWFAQQFSSEAKETKLGEFKGWEIKESLFLLENLRFYKEEKDPVISTGKEFVRKLAGLADIYVNEAFGSSHRAQASIAEIPKILPHFAGFHFIKEVKVLESIINSPKRPLAIVLGGAKMETKLPIVVRMHEIADYILIGGKLTDQDRDLIEREKINSQKAEIIIANLNEEGTDITHESLLGFEDIISKSGMIVWNGPVGVITPPTQNSKVKAQNLEEGDEGYTSLKIAGAIIGSNAYKIAGGGDTVAFLNEHGLFDKFDFVSMGGGSMLEFLSGESLPGIVALQS